MQVSGWTIRQRVLAGTGVTLILSLCLAGYCVWWIRPALSAMTAIQHDQLPEIGMAMAFEREILNARIHFIYHVTVQKPGALELGWERYRRAQALMPKLQAQVAGSPALAELRPATDDLARDLDLYEPRLREILDVVANHQNSGPAFSPILANWAAAGGRVVDAAGALSRRCSEIAQNAGRENAANLRMAILWMILTSGAALLVGLLIARLLCRNIAVLEKAIRDLSTTADAIGGTSGRVPLRAR